MKRQALPTKRLPEWEEICAVASSVQVEKVHVLVVLVTLYTGSTEKSSEVHLPY